MCSQNNIKPTDVLTNLWHMFVYSGFRCLQFSGALLSRRTVFTNAGVNTGGETGTNSQWRKQAHLVRACWKKSHCSIPETLSPIPVPCMSSNGRKASSYWGAFWQSPYHQGQWQEWLISRAFCSHHWVFLRFEPNLSLVSTFMRLTEMLSLSKPGFIGSTPPQHLSCRCQTLASPLQWQGKVPQPNNPRLRMKN